MIDIPGPTYQDIWINGIVKSGQRDCASRFDIISEFLSQYKRTFTILDVGACYGYFGIRIAQTHDAVVVMMDLPGPTIPELCKLNHVTKTMFLGLWANADIIKRLAASEHFDVVLGLSVLHHIPDWKEVIPYFMQLGDNIIIETPPPGDWAGPTNNSNAIWQTLQTYDYNILGATKSHLSNTNRPLLLFQRNKKTITKQCGYPEKRKAPAIGDILITSDFNVKSVYFGRKNQLRDWIPGINLWNFKLFNGIYPEQDTIINSMSRYYNLSTHHGDIRPWNFIYDGKDTHLIDWNDSYNTDKDDNASLRDAIGTFIAGM